MTGVVKTEYSPKKGKENKNISNHIPVPSTTFRKNAKNEALTPKKEKCVGSPEVNKNASPEKKSSKVEGAHPQKGTKEEEDSSGSTTNRSIRPQTKILRRPTPNLKHPVIQVDSDDSSGDSSSSDKSKDDNPKRQKMGSENNQDISSNKRKNFIMYNKYNVDKNTKNAVKERTSATIATSIPNPCNSCSRSQAPERLHSHARKDARGLMNRRSPAIDVKMTSPQKKPLDNTARDKVVKNKETKSIPPSPSHSKEDDTQNTVSAPSPSVVQIENKESTSDISKLETPTEDFVEPLKACYVCQEEFKVSLLLLHESKCLETWKKTNNSLTPNLRQLPPRRSEDSSSLTCSSSNEDDDPAWSAVQSQLIPCPLCSRTFFPERLPVHRRVCKGKQSPRPLKRASSLREQSASSNDGEESKATPLYLPCYVCSRNYGSWVLPMHEQQCLKKWRKENEKLAEGERREEPRKLNKSSSDDDVASLIELGNNAWESHLQQLVPCPRCSRTFFPDRLEIHERSCKGPSCNRRPRSNKGI